MLVAEVERILRVETMRDDCWMARLGLGLPEGLVGDHGILSARGRLTFLLLWRHIHLIVVLPLVLVAIGS